MVFNEATLIKSPSEYVDWSNGKFITEEDGTGKKVEPEGSQKDIQTYQSSVTNQEESDQKIS